MKKWPRDSSSRVPDARVAPVAPCAPDAPRVLGAPEDSLECTVTFRRTHPSDCGQRQVFVRLDAGQSIPLVYGESVTFEVKPGGHQLRAHNTLFWKKIAFAIEPAEHIEFLLINEARWWTAGMVGLLGSAPLFLTVKKISVI